VLSTTDTAAHARDAIARYEQSLADIPGWLDAIDFSVLRFIDEIQERIGLVGDLLEIGAYQGRTAVLLQYFCRGSERLAVCDVFEGPTGDAENERERDEFYTDLTRASFERHFRAFHPTLPDIHQCRSQDLEPRLRGRTFRLVHVDGSHKHDVVRGDLRLAKRVTASGGVVAIDDYRREHTPGVAAAAWEQVLNEGLLPICLTAGKLYGCWQHADRYGASLRALATADPAIRLEEHVLTGHDVVRLSDASIVGPSREEHLAARLAALEQEHAAQGETSRRAADEAQREIGHLQAALEAVRAEIAEATAALAASRRALAVAESRIEAQSLELAKREMLLADLEHHRNLLEAALGRWRAIGTRR
jgi:hypothetical protein